MFLEHVRSEMESDPQWKEVMRTLETGQNVGIHIAIFVEPYLRFILDGTKTVELAVLPQWLRTIRARGDR